MAAATETSAGVVLFRGDTPDAREYLVLLSAHGPWEFPKGKLEPGETVVQAAIRELAEETGLVGVGILSGFARQISYHFRGRSGAHRGKLVHKTVHYLLAQDGGTADVRISREHRQFAFLPFGQALSRLTHAGPRAVLREAAAFLDAKPPAPEQA